MAAVPLVPMQVLRYGRGELAGLRHLSQFDKVEAAASEKIARKASSKVMLPTMVYTKNGSLRARVPSRPTGGSGRKTDQAQLPEQEPMEHIQRSISADRPVSRNSSNAKYTGPCLGLLHEAATAMSTTIEETANMIRLRPSRPTWY